MIVKSIVALIAGLLLSINLMAGMPILKGIGGDFSLNSSLGKQVNLTDFRGQVVLMFFGYTNCADICPTTMAHMSQLMDRLEPEHRSRVQVLFVSIDGDNDTPSHLNKYLAYFDPSFIGLVDTRDKIDAVAAQYHAEYAKLAQTKVTTIYKKLTLAGESTEQEGYLFSHTAKIYVMGAQGRVRGYFYIGTPHAEMQSQIKQLLKE